MLEINIFSSIHVLAAFMFLFFRKNNALPNKVLALALLMPGLNFISNTVILTENIHSFPWAYFTVQITAALFAPLTFHYIKLMIGRPYGKLDKWLIGISGLIILFGIYNFIHFARLPANEQYSYLNGIMGGPYPPEMLAYSALFFIHQLLYFTCNAIQVWRYKDTVRQSLSNLEGVKLVYLARFVGLLWLLTFFTLILYGTIDTVYVEYVYLPIVISIIFFFIVYYAFNQHALFTLNEYELHLKRVRSYGSGKAVKLIKTPDNSREGEKQDLYEQVMAHIHKKQLFRNPELNLQEVAMEIGAPTYQVAQAIKDRGTSFYELIRTLRVEEAKKMLIDKDCKFTIEAIGYDAGFKSRASFYRAFKKFEGKDPSSIIKEGK